MSETLTDIYDRLRKIKIKRKESKTMKRVISTALVAAGLVLGVGACNMPNPCAQLALPTAQELAAVQAGSEVEREVSGGRVDCELVNGTWTREQE